MCLSETSLVAIICSSIVMIGSLITTYITLHNHSLEKYKMKQEVKEDLEKDIHDMQKKAFKGNKYIKFK